MATGSGILTRTGESFAPKPHKAKVPEMMRLITPFRKSIRLRVVFFSVGAALCAGLLVAVLYDLRTRDAALERGIEELSSNARLVGEQFAETHRAMLADATIVSRLPPIDGLIRARRNGGVDPFDGTARAQWRDRLETIFVSIMTEAPAYEQMRFIGVANNGRELVRVDRAGDDFVIVPEDRLQEKGAEPYAIAGFSLNKGDTYFSEVTLNRENGEVDPREIYMVRVVIPVFDARDEMFGVVVINADYEKILRTAFERVAAEPRDYIVYSSGFSMERNANGEVGSLEQFGSAEGLDADIMRGAELRDASFVSDTMIAYRRSLSVLPNGQGPVLTIVVKTSREALLGGIDAARLQAFFLALGVALVVGVAAAVVARRLVEPLREFTQNIMSLDKLSDKPMLAFAREDEIGDLARAFARKAALRASEMRARAFFENATDAIVTIDENGFIVAANAACEQMFGYDEREMLGRNVSMLMPEDAAQRHDALLHGHMKSGREVIIGRARDIRGQRKSGEQFPIEIAITESSVSGARLFTGAVRDITERKVAESERQKLIERLERSNADLRDFAYIASHDLREPLRAIAGHAGILAATIGEKLEDGPRNRLERICGLTERMDRLMRELLAYSKLDRHEVKSEPVDIAALVREIADDHQEVFEARNVKLVCEEDLPTVSSVAPLLRVAFQNLIVNGIKYNNSSEKKIEVGCTNARRGGGNIKAFYVKDNGIGIDYKYQSDIFRLFKRLSTDDQYGSGTGAGLTFVKKMVDTLGGEIWIESEVGSGSTFFFTING